jgi:hypothetical protein
MNTVLFLSKEVRQSPEKVQIDKTELAFIETSKWKAQKRKGKIILHFDGSGVVKAVEECWYV